MCRNMVSMNPTSMRFASGVVSLALGWGAHISQLNISLQGGLHLIPTINIIRLGFSYIYICVVLLIAYIGICDIGTANVAYGFLYKQHHIKLMIGPLLIYYIMLIPAELGDALCDQVCLPPCNEPISAL